MHIAPHSNPEAAFPALLRKRVRRGFERVAAHYADGDAVAWNIGQRLLEHLDPVRLSPARILDAGSGPGRATRALARRYKQATVFAVDAALPMLLRGRGRGPRWFSRRRHLCADATRLPVADASMDLVHANLLVPFLDNPDAVFAEFARVSAPGGMLLLSNLGPDTLKELRASWRGAGTSGACATDAAGFTDMHDTGDALIRAGFCDVVMDTERLTVRYRTLADLLRELRTLGGRSARPAGGAGLRSAARMDAFARNYERLREGGTLPVSVEVVYAHAWRAEAGGRAVPQMRF